MIAYSSSCSFSVMRAHRIITQVVPLSLTFWRPLTIKCCNKVQTIKHFSTSKCTYAKDLVPSSSTTAPVKPPLGIRLVTNAFKLIGKELPRRAPKLYQQISKNELSQAAFVTFEDILEMIPVEEFFYDFNMPDTFASWFTVVELHLWMISARIMKEETIGYHARDMLTEAFFQDVTYRSSLLGIRASLYRKKHIAILGHQFTAAYYGYDEGIQSSDKVLAAIVWRRFFGFECDDAQLIERVVKYIRVQMDHLSHFSFEEIMFNRNNFSFIPLSKVQVE